MSFASCFGTGKFVQNIFKDLKQVHLRELQGTCKLPEDEQHSEQNRANEAHCKAMCIARRGGSFVENVSGGSRSEM